MYRGFRTLPLAAVVFVLGACTDNAAPHGANFLTLSSSQGGACGRSDQQLRCWGYLASIPGASSSVPVQPGAPISSLRLVRTSPFDEGGCGLDSGGALFCWQYNGSGYRAVAPSLRFTDVTMGSGFQCALATSQTVYCWGAGSGTGVSAQDTAVKQCGTGLYTYACIPEPTPISSDQRFKAVASGFYHTCGVAQSGQVFCWGSGAIGAGTDLQESDIPVPVESSDRFSTIASASEGSCAINNAGQPLCWGFNTGGMLGPGEIGLLLPEPTSVELAPGVVMKTISLGYSHTCAVDASGGAWCWGTGGLGSGTSSSAVPVRVLGGLTFQSLAAGSAFTCGVSGDGAWCWGANNNGQLGNGGTSDSPIPVRVANQDQFD